MKMVFWAMMCVASVATVEAKSLTQWESCVDKLATSANQTQIGVVGVNELIQQNCGDRPIDEAAMRRPEGRLPFDVLRSKHWQGRFTKIAGKDYALLEEGLTVSNTMKPDGAWLVGSGYDPRGGGASSAVIAVNVQTGQVMAAYDDAGSIRFYGFKEHDANVPKSLRNWLQESVNTP